MGEPMYCGTQHLQGSGGPVHEAGEDRCGAHHDMTQASCVPEPCMHL